MPDQSIIDRIHKLNVLAHRGTEHEATRAAERVRALLDKHNLEIGEVELAAQPAAEQDVSEPLKKRPHHFHFLMDACQKLFGVGGYWLRCRYPGDKKLTWVPIFYGSKSNVSAAVVSFQYFKAVVDELYRVEVGRSNEHLLFRMVAPSSRAFKLGCSEQIAILVDSYLKSLQVTDQTKAIVRVTDALVLKHTEKLKTEGMRDKPDRIELPEDQRAYLAGKRAGNSVDIHGAGKRLENPQRPETPVQGEKESISVDIHGAGKRRAGATQ
jgi:Protein of unknown function (DUF2786)